ncbi:MAG: hypothetical protein R2824_15080 [Saprospiraceae bacterium]|nr:hypothetical protein [Lewinella sp.]
MPIILGVLGLLFPRVLIVVLWLFTSWFRAAFDNIIYLLLGLIFLPLTTLWYSIVINFFGGQWGTVPIIGMVIAIVVDLGGWRSSRKLRW